MTDVSDHIHIENPEWYIDHGYAEFARLRREDPLYYYEPLDTYVITRYEDVRAISRDYKRFSVTNGVQLNHIKYEGLMERFYLDSGEKIMYIDPPAHKDLRRFLAPSFTPPAIRNMEDTMRRMTVALLDKIVPGESFDIFGTITSVLPVQAINILIGLPVEDVDEVRYWSDLVMAGAADLEPQELLEAAAKLKTVHGYLDEHVDRHRGDPGTALIPTILRGLLRGEPVTPAGIHTILQDIMVAGHETTRDYLSGTVHAFAEFPDQYRRLHETPALIRNAVEECLRWVCPVRAHMRTLVEDVEYNGRQMRRGQHTWLLYMSANRDESVWENPDTFDVGRPVVPGHMTFGFGEHSCIGAAVARLEGRIFMEELVKRFSRIEITGAPTTPESVAHNAFEYLPVALYR